MTYYGWYAIKPNQIYLSIYLSIYQWDAYDKFPDFFRMGTFIDSTHMKL